jgi:hypothetical protein
MMSVNILYHTCITLCTPMVLIAYSLTFGSKLTFSTDFQMLARSLRGRFQYSMPRKGYILIDHIKCRKDHIMFSYFIDNLHTVSGVISNIDSSLLFSK